MCLENGNLGIFESPTGTGKTLSIICGALKWLIDSELRQKSRLVEKQAELDSKIKEIEAQTVNDWFSVQTEQIELNQEKKFLQNKLDALAKQEEKKIKYKERVKQYNEQRKKSKQRSHDKWRDKKNNQKQESQNGEMDGTESKDNLIDEDLILKDIDCRSDSSEDEETTEESSDNCKIFFCSRTHSQLSQFVGELKKSPYFDKVSLVSLASR